MRRSARPSQPLRIALVGCGAVAKANLLPVLAGHEGVRLAALVDRDEQRARELAQAYEIPRVLADLDQLARLDVDGVVLATPPAHHAPATVVLAERGFHVLVEKPMATSAADAARMVAAAERAGIVLSVGLYRRFLPSVRLLKHLIGTEEFGAPLALDIEEGGTYGWALATLDGLTRESGGGGVLMDIGTHLIDELLYVLPGELRIRRFSDNARGGVETDCELHGDLIVSAGCLPVRMELSRTRDLRNSIRIECEQAALELRRPDFTQVLVHRRGRSGRQSEPVIKLAAEWAWAGKFVGYQAFRDEIDDWVSAVADKTTPLLSGRSVLPVSQAIEDCYRLRTPAAEPWTDEGLAPDTRRLTSSGRTTTAGPAARRRRVLVTGAGGFLGGRTVEVLRERYGYEVVALVRRPGSAARLARWPTNIVVGDVCSRAAISRALDGCDAVVHCAVGTDWQPDATRRTTVEGTRIVAVAARAAGVGRFVHVSTLNVHRRDLPGVLDESTPLDPPATDRYGRAKLEAERALAAVGRGLSTIVLRPTRIYGPFSKTFTVRPLQALDAGRFGIAGNPDVPANMVYVDNVVEAIAKALEASDNVAGQAFLITDPDQVTLREFYEYFARGREIRFDAALPSKDVGRPGGLLNRWTSGLMDIARSPEFRGLVRKALYTDPIGVWPRRWWERSPSLQANLLRRFGSNAAVVYRPAPENADGPLLYYGEPATVSSARAAAALGYRGDVSRQRAMELTQQWARHARLSGDERL